MHCTAPGGNTQALRSSVPRRGTLSPGEAQLGGPSYADRLVETSGDAIFALGADGTVLSWNGGARALFGYEHAEAIGRTLESLVVPPARRAEARDTLANVLALGIVSFETTRARKDGSLVAVTGSKRVVRGTAQGADFVSVTEREAAHFETSPVRNHGAEASFAPLDSEDVMLASTASGDISDRKAADARFRALLESAPDAMVIVDSDGRMVLVNAQMDRLFGYAREELLGRPIEMLVPERFRGRHPGYRAKYFAHPTARAMAGTAVSLFGLRKDGTEFAAEISLGPIETPEGTLATAAIRDITERRRLEEAETRRKSRELEEENRQMQEANRLKSEFLANMSHELRTPLNAIIGFAELMFRGKVGPVSVAHREYLGDILDSSRHLLQLINDVLDLAKVESGKMEFRPEPIDLGKVVGEVRDILRGLASTKHIRVEVRVDPQLGAGTLDPAKLKQVLYNYLSNALKFTPEGGRITVQVAPEGVERVRIDVEDTGIGVRVEDTHRLFVEFQQLDAGTAKKYPGTGLGLALTKRIVEAQGGRVAVRSVLGQGSVFSAILPLHAAGFDTARRRRPPPRRALRRGGFVLAVDIVPGELRLMDAALKRFGCAVKGVAGPVDALAAIAEALPEAVVLDVAMPEADGFELLGRLGDIPTMRDIPVIVWTSNDLTQAERTRLLSSAHEIVFKSQGGTEGLMAALGLHLALPSPGVI